MTVYVFYYGEEGTPKTGLSPTLDVFVKESDGTSAGTPPTPIELSGGNYKFTFVPTYNVVIRLDSNDAAMADADRYIPLVASPHDDDLDAAISTLATTAALSAHDAKLDTVDALVDRILTATEVRQCSVIDAAPTSLAFETSLTETGNTFWRRQAILMTSGTNKGQNRAISSWNGTSHKITLKTPLDNAPANGDLFIILPLRKFLTPDIEDIIATMYDELRSAHVAAGSFGEAITDLHDEAFGKWILDPSAKTLTLYKADGITILKAFDLTDTSSTVPAFITRTPQ